MSPKKEETFDDDSSSSYEEIESNKTTKPMLGKRKTSNSSFSM